MGRPVVFLVGRQLAGRRTAGGRDAFDRQWTDAAFRRGCRRMTAIWGAALLGEAAVRITLAFVLPTAVLLLVGPLLALAVFGPLAYWSLRRYRRRTQTQALTRL